MEKAGAATKALAARPGVSLAELNRDAQLQRRLWTVSEELIGVAYLI